MRRTTFSSSIASAGREAAHATIVGTALTASTVGRRAQPPMRWLFMRHLTLPHVRAVIQDVLTAHFFITNPRYLDWMLTLKEVELRN